VSLLSWIYAANGQKVHFFVLWLDKKSECRYDAFFKGGQMKKILFAVFLLVAFSVFLSADIYIKTNVHTDAFEMMGQKQPAKDESTEQWMGNNQMAMISKDKVMVTDMNKNLMYIINTKDKSYVQTALPLDMSKLVPKEAAGMMGMMKMTVKVAPNGQSQKVGKWNCSGYDVDMSMMMMQMKIRSGPLPRCLSTGRPFRRCTPTWPRCSSWTTAPSPNSRRSTVFRSLRK
jgi:hypothetical protein